MPRNVYDRRADISCCIIPDELCANRLRICSSDACYLFVYLFREDSLADRLNAIWMILHDIGIARMMIINDD